MTAYYPIVIETETSGAVSAYVPGLPVYAAADTRAKVERAIRETLAVYLDAHPTTSPTTRIRSPASRTTGSREGTSCRASLAWAPFSVPAAAFTRRVRREPMDGSAAGRVALVRSRRRQLGAPEPRQVQLDR